MPKYLIFIKFLLFNYLYLIKLLFRDLKPDNILTKPLGDVLKIIDFNVCKKVKCHQNMKFDINVKKNIVMMDTVGNISFAAPEMLKGYNEYTEQIDLWNTG